MNPNESNESTNKNTNDNDNDNDDNDVDNHFYHHTKPSHTTNDLHVSIPLSWYIMYIFNQLF